MSNHEYCQELISRAGPTPQKMVAHWWPIFYPDFKDLPPTLQVKVAAAQVAEERRRLEMVQ